MGVKQLPHTVADIQGLRRASTALDAEAREHPVPGGSAGARVRRVLVWSALTLLAAPALALAMVLASLAVAPADPAPPPPTSPLQFGPSMGHARPYSRLTSCHPGDLGESGLIGDVNGPGKRDREAGMALFMEVHTINGGVSMEDVAKAHVADLEIQSGYGVRYLRYWVDERDGKVFCLVEAPSSEAAASVHRQAHGQVADKIYQVREGL